MYEKYNIGYLNLSDDEEEEDTADDEDNSFEGDQSTEEEVDEDNLNEPQEDEEEEDEEEDEEEETKEADNSSAAANSGKGSQILVPNMETLSIKNMKDKVTKNKSEPEKSTRPATMTLVMEAIQNLCERKGSSVQAIKKYIINKNVGIDEQRLRLSINKSLRKGVADGILEQTKGLGATGSFKISAKYAKDQLMAEKIKAKKAKAMLLEKEKERKQQDKKKLMEAKKKLKMEKAKDNKKDKQKKAKTTKTTNAPTTNVKDKSPKMKSTKKTDATKAADIIFEDTLAQRKKKPAKGGAAAAATDVGVRVENENPIQSTSTGANPKPAKKASEKTKKTVMEKQTKKTTAPPKKLKGDKALEAMIEKNLQYS